MKRQKKNKILAKNFKDGKSPKLHKKYGLKKQDTQGLRKSKKVKSNMLYRSQIYKKGLSISYLFPVNQNKKPGLQKGRKDSF